MRLLEIRSRSNRVDYRAGVSLVELLIVIGIMVAVMAVAIPVVRLTTNDNRVSLATQTVRSFLMEAAAAAERDGKSYVYFERNVNNPNYCYRLYRGRPRPLYRGESEVAYAVQAPAETVVLPGVPGGSPPVIPGPMEFQVFYLFSADASRIRPYEVLKMRDRPEKYLIYQSFQMPPNVSTLGPVAKVYCRLDPQTPLSPDQTQRSGLRALSGGTEFAPVAMPHNGWAAASTAVPQRAGGGVAMFWPADRVYYPSTGTASPIDIPNFVGSNPGQFTSRLFAFEVSQPPMLDELNYLDLPQGMAIYLGGSGFGEEDSFGYNSVVFQNSPRHIQFAFNENLAALSDATVATAVNNELLDPTFSFFKNADSPIRAEYFPRIEFEAGGRITRAMVMSPRYTAAGSALVSNSNKIARLGPHYPLSPLFLLIGEDNVQQRSALPVDAPVLANDYWIMLGAQTSTPKVVKAQAGLNLEASRYAVAGSVSEQ
ncbi:MAG: hypothetical protein JNL67_22475 [Planctomycetaceae bacterium]|nr:hypothetical protein [Planctomycetaceae bacterium]